MKFAVYLCLTVLLPVALSAVCPALEGQVQNDLFKGQSLFSFKFLREMLKVNPDKSVFFSPYSVYRALLLAYTGSSGSTETTLYEALNLQWSQNKNQVIKAFKDEKEKRKAFFSAEEYLEFESADKFFFSNELEINECLSKSFDEEIEKLDLSNKVSAAKHINSWIENVTKNYIKDFLEPNSIDDDAKLVLANAAYFKGLWGKKFYAQYTEKADFQVNSNKNITVDMMKMTDQFKFYDSKELGCKVLEMPYKDKAHSKRISFLTFLPPLETNFEDLLVKFTPETLEKVVESLQSREVSLKFPRFSFEQKTELQDILTQMGLGALFSGNPDFSEFTKTRKLGLGKAKHLAKIEIDENGSKAAAVTTLELVPLSGFFDPNGPTDFHCDHPFLYMIYDHESHAILFTGIYRG